MFLGAFEKLRKATNTFVMSVRLSVCVEQLGFYGTDFHEIWYLSIFRKFIEKNSMFIKIWQEWRVIYMQICVLLW